MDFKVIGAYCKRYRQYLGYTQGQVADEIGCSKGNISAFECGRNVNGKIFLWYITKGFDFNQAVEGDLIDGKPTS